jgi:RecB family exonuclease
LAGGPRGTRADADLDAVLALFAAASRHDARKPGSGPAGFAAYLEAQEVPSDTIAAQAPPGDRVTVSTAAAAVGREWELVALVGLQEDVWPDLRLRDTLLGAGQLADIVDGKDAAAPGAARRREVLDDEVRSLALALTRARGEVLAVAVANSEEQPSRFFDWLAGDSPTASGDGRADDRHWPFDLRGIVAEARATLAGPGAPGGPAVPGGLAVLGEPGGAAVLGEPGGAARPGGPGGPGGLARLGGGRGLADEGSDLGAARADAARVLAALAALGVEGANPADWPGLVEPSRPGGVYGDRQVPVLSPSKVESLADCPLVWALEKVGGARPAGDRATLGSLIHWLAQRHPKDGPDQMERHLREHWPELGLPDGYSSRRLLEEAARMARRLGVYQQAHPDLLANEVEIVPAPAALPVRLVGRIDRLEAVGDGQVRVVDFKTGSQIPGFGQAQRNAQLGSYQVAVNSGMVPPHRRAGEAALVYLRGGSAGPAERRQPPLPGPGEPNWMIDLLRQCARDAAGPSYQARPGPHCRHCRVKTCCPAWPEGKQVIA